jgi:hypothetical protein
LMTIRRLMAAVAIVAFLTSALICMSNLELDDRFDGATSKGNPTSWSASASPKIVVDAFGGAIMVKPSLDGRITAVIEKHSLCKNLSEDVAKDALRYVQVDFVQEGDTIRIVTRPTADMPKNNYAVTGNYIYVSTTVEVWVPDGARLDLRTGFGSIWVEGRPVEIRSKNSGALRFDLGPIRGADGGPAVLKLKGSGGEASVDFDGTNYRYRGDVKPTQCG